MKFATIFNERNIPKFWTRLMLVSMVFWAFVLLLMEFTQKAFFPEGAPESFLCASLVGLAAIYVPVIPEKYWFPTVLGLLAVPFFTLFCTVFSLLLGISISLWCVVIAWLLAIGVMKRFSLPGTLRITIPLTLVIWFASAFFVSLTWDFTHEGESFQKPAIILLTQDWNPIYEPHPAKNITDPLFDRNAVEFYPKGQIFVSAAYARFFGTPEAGDSVYFTLIPCAFLLLYNLFKNWLKLGKYELLLLTAALVLNPMLLYEELFSGQTDGILALTLLIFLFASWTWIRTGNKKWRPFVVWSLVYGSLLQFSALWFFACIWIGLSLVYIKPHLFLDENPVLPPRKWFSGILISGLLVLLGGFHPFITSTFRESNPFYPVCSFSSKHPVQNVMKPWYENPQFKKSPQFNRCIYTLFDCQRPPHPGEKVGPQHDARRVQFFAFFSDHPFGIFPLVLLGAVPCFLLVRRAESWLILGVLLIGLVVYPYVWSEFFAPQIRAVPLLLIAFLLSDARKSAGNHEIQEGFLLHRGTILFRTVFALLVWSSVVAFGWALQQQYFLAAQCFKAEKMLQITKGIHFGTIWEMLPLPAKADGESHYVSPRPMETTRFYFQQLLSSPKMTSIPMEEIKSPLSLRGWNYVVLRTLVFTFPYQEGQGVPEPVKKADVKEKTEASAETPEKEEPKAPLGSAFNRVPMNYGSAYRQWKKIFLKK